MKTDVSSCLAKSLQTIRLVFSKDATFRVREFSSGLGVRCALLYLNAMADGDALALAIVKPLVEAEPMKDFESPSRVASDRALFAGEVKAEKTYSALCQALLIGDSVLLFEGATEGLIIDTKGWITRGISEPINESVLQGPREGFCEAAMKNLTLIRRKLLTTDLCIESFRIGRRTQTSVFLCYFDSLVSKRMLKEIKKRLSSIDIDGILDSNYLNELIRDHPNSVFQTVGSTERPDVVAAKLLEGRAAILVDGTPVVLTVPYLFVENFQSDEDYYLNFWVASIGRFLRYLCFFFAVSVPAMYLALITYHKRLLPTFLLLSTAQSRSEVPFSSLAECLLLLFVLEILKETGARMPQNLGHTLGIIGGLVVGQAAVEAHLVSAPMLIVVSVCGVAGLMIPRLRAAVFYTRLLLIFLAVLFGLPGCFAGLIFLTVRILGLSSFGVPCAQPLRNPTVQGWKDTVVRLSWSKMIQRPDFNRNRIRFRRRK